MTIQQQIQKKPLANMPAARSHTGFESRGFTVQTKEDAASHQSADFKTQLSQAARFGHNMNRMAAMQTKAPLNQTIQRQEEKEEPEQMKSEAAVQRQEEKEEPEQMKSETAVQRLEEKEEPEQMKSETAQRAIQRQNASNATSSGSGNSMPAGVRAKMENSFGTSFADVNIHTNSVQAKSIGALAYTQGNNVHFAPGQYNPQTSSGQSLLGHELTHVVQQRAGRVPVPTQSKGAPINADPALEKEADEMGAKAAQGKLVQMSTGGVTPNQEFPVQNSTEPVQFFLPLIGGMMSGLLGGGGAGGLLSGVLGGAASGLAGGLTGGGGPGGLLGGILGGAASGLAGGLAGGGGAGGLLSGVLGGAVSGLAGGLAGGGGPGGLVGGVLGGAANGLADGLAGGGGSSGPVGGVSGGGANTSAGGPAEGNTTANRGNRGNRRGGKRGRR